MKEVRIGNIKVKADAFELAREIQKAEKDVASAGAKAQARLDEFWQKAQKLTDTAFVVDVFDITGKK